MKKYKDKIDKLAKMITGLLTCDNGRKFFGLNTIQKIKNEPTEKKSLLEAA
jgi:hypothetical protein